ncbi:ATP-binding protein [Streptomyces orinoci]|uniref:ATP-binding protein n=1 Tax=Streptomyces orinoci TaxID=67339 RepID=A0ABV3K048_STRON|nr:ATP-binding protein [Streptomyces orinoci]
MISRVNKHCTVELQALPQRIGQVRRIVSAQLRYWHLDSLIDTAALGVTELLTNVHQHAGPDKRCTVELALVQGQLTVSVRDHGPRLPRLTSPGRAGTHGRGLALIAALSTRWGVQRHHEGGKVVWFTLREPVAAPAAGPAPAVRTGAGRRRPAALQALQEGGLGAPGSELRPTPLGKPSAARSAVAG